MTRAQRAGILFILSVSAFILAVSAASIGYRELVLSSHAEFGP